MTAQIIDGRSLAQQIRETLKFKVSALKKKPHLAVVLVGNDEASLIYDRNKQKAALEIGMKCNIHHLPEDIKQDELNNIVDALNKDKDVNGIIVQMPLPRHLDAKDVLKRISPEKDVDGFGVENLGLLLVNSSQALVAATPKGILKLIQSVEPHLAGKNAVIIGRSTIVGKPLAALLLNHDCSVTVLHSKSVGISDFVRQADIVVAACGNPLFVKKEWIKSGAIVIDVGINRCNGKLVGDVDFDNVRQVAGAITPVPGGVGPMTVAMLLDNTFEAYIKQNKEL